MSLRCPDGHLSESEDYCDVCGLPLDAGASAVGASVAGASAAGPSAARPAGALDLGPPVPTVAMPTDKTCPNCQSLVPEDDLFCEVCGYDFTTGALPAPVTAPGGIPVQHGSAAQVGGAAAVTPAPAHPAGVGGPGSSGSGSSGSGSSGPGSSGSGSSGSGSSGSGSSGSGSSGPGSSGSGSPGGPSGPVPSGGQTSTLTWVAEVWVDPDWYGTQESDEPCPSAGLPVILPLWERSVLVGRTSVSRNIHPQIDCAADHGVSRRHAQLTTDGQRWWAEDLQSSNGTFISPAGAPLPSAPIPPGQRIEFAPGDRVYVGAWTRIVVRKATSDGT